MSNKRAIRFAIGFSLLFGVLILLVNARFAEPLMEFTITHTIRLLVASLSLFHVPCAVDGSMVDTGGFVSRIIRECTSIYMIILYVSFLAAFPASWKNRLKGAAFGIPLIVFVNNIRLMIGSMVGIHFYGLYPYYHIYVSQIALVLFCICLCIGYSMVVTGQMKMNPLMLYLFRSFAVSSLIYVPWIWIHGYYANGILAAAETVLGLIGFSIVMFTDADFIPSCFNLVVFMGLILASTRLTGRSKWIGLVSGIFVISLFELLYAVTSAFVVILHRTEWEPYFRILDQFNHLALPFILAGAIQAYNRKKTPDLPQCPICGDFKAGLLQHLKTKHKEEYEAEPEAFARYSQTSPSSGNIDLF